MSKNSYHNACDAMAEANSTKNWYSQHHSGHEDEGGEAESYQYPYSTTTATTSSHHPAYAATRTASYQYGATGTNGQSVSSYYPTSSQAYQHHPYVPTSSNQRGPVSYSQSSNVSNYQSQLDYYSSAPRIDITQWSASSGSMDPSYATYYYNSAYYQGGPPPPQPTDLSRPPSQTGSSDGAEAAYVHFGPLNCSTRAVR